MSDTTFPYDDEVEDPYRDDDTKNPHEPTATDGDDGDDGDDTDDGDEDGRAEEAPPRRRPGRPRKNPAS